MDMGTVAGMLSGWSARGGGYTSRGVRFLTALGLLQTAIFITSTAASAESVMKRAILGTIVASGTVEVANEPGEWIPGSNGAPVLEDSEFRTQAGQTTMVALGNDGVIGLGEQSHLRVGKDGLDGLPLSLMGDGSLSFRLPPTSDLSIFTDAAVVKGQAAGSASGEETSAQGTITQKGGETTVSVIRGVLLVRNHGAEQSTSLASGDQATVISPQETPRLSRMTETSETQVQRRLTALGFLGTKTGVAVAGATAAVGGGVAAAAATGAFSGGDDDDDTVPAQGSPFAP